MNTLTKLLLIFFVVLSCNSLFAEGSKDFRNYPGTRMWLDTRDDQQLKVYAVAGEFLNIGASHVGKAGGFIQVYRPDGTLHVTYDGTGSNPNEAIIFNSTQEDAGPNGGGTTNGAGYQPGVIQVQAGQEGIWTVVMDFPTYVSSFFNNIQNGDSWTRSANQPNFGRAILSWDISVTENGAGNNGGAMKEGRVFSNEFITLIQSNGNLTSPTLFVLTRDGFIYQVDIDNADPYRFPISSSGIGFTDANLIGADQSQAKADVIRSSEPSTWSSNQTYFYEPQAQDTSTFLINNKIFFNYPDTLMPNFTETTDVFRSNPHTTWLRPELPELDVNFGNVAIESDTAGLDGCSISAIGFGEGGYFIFTSTREGRGVMELDLNENGLFGEPFDVSIPFVMIEGENVIFWDGNNGSGEPVPVGEYDIGYALIVRAGEVHITLADVENNPGGVTFELLNGLGGNPPNEFFYDHTNLGGGVSGVFGQPGYAQPTTTPFTYTSNFGNNKLLDYWAYVNFDGNLGGTLPVAIIPECGPFVLNDNDEDGIPDDEDIDDDNDGVADVLEYCNGSFDFSCLPGGLDPSHDEDNDGVLNYLDADDPLVNNSCIDANDNGICDDLDPIYDTDGDGVADHLDLDSDNDGILDLVEAGHTAVDANGDGVIDGLPEDFGLNGLYNDLAADPDDLMAVANYTPWDFDNDGIPDHDDLDSDNDGINDVVEAGWVTGDTDNDGVIDDNGVPASVGSSGLVTLINPLATGVGVPYPQDHDNDGIPDWHDLDSDNDGIHDVEEAIWPDPDNDGIIGAGTPQVDVNGLAVEDDNGEALATTSMPNDHDGDMVPDWHDLDTDNDGINDVTEAGFADEDGDGIVGTGVVQVSTSGVPTQDANGNPLSSTSNPMDWDEDTVPDYRDLDSDNDVINDVAEAGLSDPDNDGIIGTGMPTVNDDGQATEAGNPITTSDPLDWDEDGIPDWHDLDSDNDGINDVSEAGFSDPDNDGIVSTGTPVINSDGQVIEDEDGAPIASTSNPLDWDEDGVPDWHDLDSDNDGINDVAEAGFSDPDEDGVIGTGIPVVNTDGQATEDSNGNPISTTSNPLDWDEDGIPDWHDLDSDNDGINDVSEAGFSDPDNDGFIGVGIPTVNDNGQATEDENGNPISTTSNPLDWDEDGVPDWHDLDSDNDGINDVAEAGLSDPDDDGIIANNDPEVNMFGQAIEDENGDPLTVTSNPQDWDGDGVPDLHDLDSDNDGINDVAEAGFSDPDNDGIIGAGSPIVNTDGQATEDDNGSPISTTSNPLDWDEDGIPDWHDLDSDNDGVNDVSEAGFSDPDNDGFIGVGIPAVNDDGQATEDENGNPISTTSDPLDWDGDGVPDWHDLDSDNDGINDVAEADFSDPDDEGIIASGDPEVNMFGQAIEDENGNPIMVTSNPIDWDEDGVPDLHDLDSDNDGINDVEEAGFSDPDNDGIISIGAPIVNDDGQTTEDENGNPVDTTSNPNDWDGDGVPNFHDLDTDNDGINDVEEAGFDDPDNDGIIGTGNPTVNEDGQAPGDTSNPLDTDGDGVPDYQDLDSDNDNINDVEEAGFDDPDNDGVVGTGDPVVNEDGQSPGNSTSDPTDTDMDGTPDYQDLDSDDDGISDVVEAGFLDPDNDGVVGTGNPVVGPFGQPDGATSAPTDSDMDGTPDYQETDSDDDGLLDEYECPNDNTCQDWDMDGTPDFQDWDSDNDGIDDGYECFWNGIVDPCPDTDMDGFVNGCDLDSDGDGIPDEEECPGGAICPDADGNGIPEVYEYNCNENSVVPNLVNPVGGGDYCEGAMINLSAESTIDFGQTLEYVWTAPDGTTFPTQTSSSTGPFILNAGPANASTIGIYTLVVFSPQDCASDFETAFTIEVGLGDIVSTTPVITTANDEVCEGAQLILNTTAVAGNSIEYTWSFTGTIITEYTTNVPQLVIDPFTADNVGDYTVQIAVDGCESNVSDPIAITLAAVPQLSNMNGSGNYCEGENIVLSATNDYTGTEAIIFEITDPNGVTDLVTPGPGNNFVYNLGSAVVNMTGMYTVIAQTSGGCASDMIEFNITVSPNPVTPIILASDTNICDGESLTLTTSDYGINANYTWFCNGDEVATTPVPTVDIASAGDCSYTVIVSVSGCESDESAAIQVVAGETPTLANQAGGGNYCEGDNITLSAEMTYVGTSAVTCTIISPTGNTTSEVLLANQDLSVDLGNAMTVMSGVWTVVCESAAGCTSNELNFVVNVGTMPVTPIINSANPSICDNAPLELTTSNYVGNVTYTWCLDAATIATTSVPSLELASPMAGNYTVSVMVNGCESAKSAPIAVTIDAAPELSNLNGSGGYCEGEMITFSADVDYPNAGNITVTITDPNNSTTTVVIGSNDDFEYTFGPAMTTMSGSYTVTLESANGCTSDATIFNISVGAMPVTPTLNLSADELCAGEDLVLTTADYGPNAIYTWNGPGLASPETPTNTFTVTAPQSGDYTVTVAVDGCTSSVSNPITFEVSGGIELEMITGAEMDLCEGDDLVLSAMNASGGTDDTNYTWTLPNGSEVIGMAPLAGPFSINLNSIEVAESGIYCLTVEGEAGCPDVTSCVDVTVNSKPAPPTLDIDDDQLCEGGLLELNATQYTGEVSYEWFFNGASQEVTAEPTFFIDPVSAVNDGEYSVIVTVDGCPSEPSNIQDLMVMATGNMDVSNSTDATSPACEGESINLSLTAIPGATYEWFGPNQFTSTIPNPTIDDVGTIDAGEYYAIVTTEFCTITTQTTAVFIEEANVSANDDSYVIEMNESLTGANITQNDGTTGTTNITIISDPENGTATIQDGRLNYVPNEDYVGLDELQYEICSAACPDICAIATVTIRISEVNTLMPCDAPNIITPNNDGMNDNFSLPCLDTDDYPAANLKIFNRWGDKIFEEDGYKNTWGGEYKGRQTPTGTYYYLLQLDPNSEECMQGYFTLTR